MMASTGPHGRRGPRPGPAGSLVAVASCLLLAAACASTPDSDHMVVAETRFAIEVAAGDHAPVFVQATSESRPVAWLRVLDGGRPVYVEERCGVPDCDDPGAVCGANLPTVKEIAARGEAGTVEYVWDGTRSVIDDVARCERREPAPPGSYVARLCYGHTMEADGDPRSAAGAVGQLTDPICVEQTFRWGRDAEVLLRIP